MQTDKSSSTLDPYLNSMKCSDHVRITISKNDLRVEIKWSSQINFLFEYGFPSSWKHYLYLILSLFLSVDTAMLITCLLYPSDLVFSFQEINKLKDFKLSQKQTILANTCFCINLKSVILLSPHSFKKKYRISLVSSCSLRPT